MIIDGRPEFTFGDYDRSLWLERQWEHESGGIGTFEATITARPGLTLRGVASGEKLPVQQNGTRMVLRLNRWIRAFPGTCRGLGPTYVAPDGIFRMALAQGMRPLCHPRNTTPCRAW